MIEDISVRYLDSFKDKQLNEPILIEGLPGIGQVGKLVAEYMIHVLGAEKIGEIHSIYFPPRSFLRRTALPVLHETSCSCTSLKRGISSSLSAITRALRTRGTISLPTSTARLPKNSR